MTRVSGASFWVTPFGRRGRMSDRLSFASCRRIAVLVVACGVLTLLPPADHASAASSRQATFEKDARQARNWLASRFDRTLKHRIRIELLDHNLGNEDGARVAARTAPMSRKAGAWVQDFEEPYQRCVIRVAAFAQERERRFRRGLLAHEVTHCLQYEAMGLKTVPRTTARYWLTEGSAEWASYEYVHGTWHNVVYWDAYASNPTRALYIRSRAAVGFYAHIDRRTRNPWRVVWRMWRAWARPGRILERHHAAFGVAQRAAGGAAFAQTWATSFARRKALGDAWEMRGPGLGPPTATQGPTELKVEATPHQAPVGPAAVGVWAFVAPDGAIVQVRGEGYATLQLPGPDGARTPDMTRAGQYSITYCVTECICPDGSNLDRRMPVAAATTPAHFAHTGGEGRARMEVRLVSADEACGITAHPCDWGFDVATITAWIKTVIDDPNRPVERVLGSPSSGGFPEQLWARGCYWLSSFGDAVWIADINDNARLRQHLPTLPRVPVGDEGWIDEFRSASPTREYDVYFRIGHRFAVAAIWTLRTDPGEAVVFATAVAAAARSHAPPCC
jgi:hypothetical protein